MSEPPALESGTVPDGIVPLVGYREWSVRREHNARPRLVSLFHPTSWPSDRPFAAVCLRPVTWPYRPVQPIHDAVPHEACQCGIYAFRQPSFESLNGATGLKARGIVIGWGRYVLGAIGWRSQMARVVALAEQEEGRELIEEVAHRYRVPVVRHLEHVRLDLSAAA